MTINDELIEISRRRKMRFNSVRYIYHSLITNRRTIYQLKNRYRRWAVNDVYYLILKRQSKNSIAIFMEPVTHEPYFTTEKEVLEHIELKERMAKLKFNDLSTYEKELACQE